MIKKFYYLNKECKDLQICCVFICLHFAFLIDFENIHVIIATNTTQ